MLNKELQKIRVSPVLLLIISLCLTATVFILSKIAIDEKARVKFEIEWKGVQGKIQAYSEAYVDQLYAGKGLFAASKSVERDEWNAFIGKQRSIKRLPGIVASEYIQVVRNNEIDAFVESVRNDKSVEPLGYPAFDVSPKTQNEQRYVVSYIEPFEANNAAFGYDMASDDVRREAFDRAMETGEVMASRKIHLLRNQSEAGFMMVLPIYKNDISVSTLAERKATIQGFVAHVISAKDFFGHSVIQSKEIAQIDFEIFDSEDMTAQNVIFDFDNELHVIDKNYKARFAVDVPIYIAERKFMMHYTASQNFGLDDGQDCHSRKHRRGSRHIHFHRRMAGVAWLEAYAA